MPSEAGCAQPLATFPWRRVNVAVISQSGQLQPCECGPCSPSSSASCAVEFLTTPSRARRCEPSTEMRFSRHRHPRSLSAWLLPCPLSVCCSLTPQSLLATVSSVTVFCVWQRLGMDPDMPRAASLLASVPSALTFQDAGCSALKGIH